VPLGEGGFRNFPEWISTKEFSHGEGKTNAAMGRNPVRKHGSGWNRSERSWGKAGIEVATKQKGADLVFIDTLKKFGDLEYPVVQFEHDKHTKAVEGKCESCHTVTGNTVTAKFKRLGRHDR
jgi:hypothetical protein